MGGDADAAAAEEEPAASSSNWLSLGPCGRGRHRQKRKVFSKASALVLLCAAGVTYRGASRYGSDALAYARLFCIAVLGAWTSATGYMVIGRLSALTHQVLGQFKMACLLLGSYVVLGADLNRQQLGGASLTMASIVLYTRCTLAQRRRLEARRRGDEPLGRSPSEDPLLSPGRRRKVANGHSSSSRRMPGVLSASSSRSSRAAGLAVV